MEWIGPDNLTLDALTSLCVETGCRAFVYKASGQATATEMFKVRLFDTLQGFVDRRLDFNGLMQALQGGQDASC